MQKRGSIAAALRYPRRRKADQAFRCFDVAKFLERGVVQTIHIKRLRHRRERFAWGLRRASFGRKSCRPRDSLMSRRPIRRGRHDQMKRL